MILTVQRFKFLDKCTVGKLLFDGLEVGIYTLEDKVREVEGQPPECWKVYGETAIPRGTYRVEITFSPHFGRELPLLYGVPGFLGVRIHAGNSDKDTEGCILVGKSWSGDDWIGESKDALEFVLDRIKDADTVSCVVK
jgi:hypothetical protein